MSELKELVQDLAQELSVLKQLFETWHRSKIDHINTTWIDGKQVMQALKISQRTLQTLRSSGKLPFSSVNQKFYYKVSDIKFLLESNYRSKGKGRK